MSLAMMTKKTTRCGVVINPISFNAACVLFAFASYCLLGVANLDAQQPNPSTDNPPNIVLIMADDLGWKDLHCYGNKNLETPNLDRLAKQGMLFTNAYSASPVCTPTRAAMMTGESPARLNITNHAPGHPPGYQKPGTKIKTALWQRHLPLDRVTLAEQLKANGYATGFVGKWHLSHQNKKSNGPTEPELRAEHQGFDINIGGCSFGGPPSYFEPYRIPNISPSDQFNYLPERCSQECINFIEENQDKPFFLCWWNYSVHYPFQAPAPLVQKYEKRKGPGIENPTYAAMIEGMDLSIGKLLASLDRLGLTENTLIIFTSDNGPFAANVKPLRGEKGYLYEGGIRVPAIVKWAGKIKPASVSQTPIISMDFHATILDAVGIEPDPSNHPDGDSLVGLFTGKSPLNRDAIYFHYPNYAFHKKNRPGSAIRSGDFKLIKFYDDNSVELYNLKDDLSEANDLTRSMPEKTAELRNKLETWLSETDAKVPANAN
ncbi:MAG: sulfatase [Mariniblastus sp.]|nr:sulfatase [Mariniblastus sp.]